MSHWAANHWATNHWLPLLHWMSSGSGIDAPSIGQTFCLHAFDGKRMDLRAISEDCDD